MKAMNELSLVARRMYISFGMLTIWTVAGPTLAFVSVGRGYNDDWPPENLAEWVGFLLAVGGFSVLMLCTFCYALRQPRRAKYVPGKKKSGQINR